MTCVMSRSDVFAENAHMEQLPRAIKRELKVLIDFVELYCHARHEDSVKAGVALQGVNCKEPRLCGECAGLLEHAVLKRLHCPLDPKPACKRCPIHCYGKDYRGRIREIMAFSGRRMILRGRLDYIRHFLF